MGETGMKMFATRVWGSGIGGRVPLATFGSAGHVSGLLRLASHGDRLVFVGTKTERTAAENRGRILAMAEFGFQPLRSMDYFDRSELDPRDFDEKGEYKFPFGVPLIRAWSFTGKPLLSDVVKQRLTMLATPGAEELRDATDITAVMALPQAETKLLDMPQLANMRRINDLLKPTTGPKPGDASYEVNRTAQEESWTYAMRYGNHNLWKVGHTTNPVERLKAVNQHIPIEIGVKPWTLELQQKWPDAVTAYEMEQKVFEILSAKRTGFERIACSISDLGTAWQQAIMGD
jgi:hypothetical protein